MVSWSTPKSKKELRSFLGLAGYYHRFVKDYAKIARVPYVWKEDCEQAFQQLKVALTTAPVLGYPKHVGRMVLDTDASGEALGAVLSQIQDGHEVVLAYMSKALGEAERNYCITRKELLAVFEACKTWHLYIYGRPVVVRTDNSAVAWAKRIKNPVRQMARWLQVLGTYDLTEVHRPGRIHWNADALGRKPVSPCGQCSRESGPFDGMPKRLGTGPSSKEDNDPHIKVCVVTRTQTKTTETAASDSEGMSLAELHEEQVKDPDISLVMQAKSLGEAKPTWDRMSPHSDALKTLWAQYDRLKIKDDVLHRRWIGSHGSSDRWQIIIPRTRRRAVLQQMHDGPLAGHFGVDKTLKKVQESFYWVNMKDDIISYCHSCDLCVARKTPGKQKHAPMKEFLIGSPMERVTTDIMSLERSASGQKYVLVVTDSFTKWTEAYAMRKKGP